VIRPGLGQPAHKIFSAQREPFAFATHLIDVRAKQNEVKRMEMLLEQNQAESQNPFISAVVAHRHAMFRAARVLLDCDADAEDAVSEAILRAWQAYSGLRKPAAVKSWLLKITVNCAYEHRRKAARLVYTADLSPLTGGKEDPHDEGLWEAVLQLPEEFRVVTVLFYYEDMSVAEIAQTLNIHKGTVRSRLSRARTRLRALLEEESL